MLANVQETERESWLKTGNLDFCQVPPLPLVVKLGLIYFEVLAFLDSHVDLVNRVLTDSNSLSIPFGAFQLLTAWLTKLDAFGLLWHFLSMQCIWLTLTIMCVYVKRSVSHLWHRFDNMSVILKCVFFLHENTIFTKIVYEMYKVRIKMPQIFLGKKFIFLLEVT